MVQAGAAGHGSYWRVALWSVAGAALLAPAVAMQFTAEVHWTGFDFVVAALLIGAAGGAIEMFARAPDVPYRLGGAVIVAAALLLVWISLAVGIIGSEDNPANWMYAGVLATLAGGAALARLQPSGMGQALLATAAVQVTAGLLAVAMHWGVEGARWPKDILGATVFFTLLWLGAAWLFRRSAQRVG